MKTEYLHAISALGLAGYLYGVKTAGGESALYALATRDLPGFMKWGLAATILMWGLTRLGGPLGTGIGTLLVASSVLSGGPKVIEAIESIVGTED